MNADEAKDMAEQQYKINIAIAKLSGKRITKKVKKEAEDMAIACVIPPMLRDIVEEVLKENNSQLLPPKGDTSP